jgi:hypothetical protein
MRRSGALLAAALFGLGLGACEDEVAPPVIRTLEGPTDIAFACRGPMRLTAGGEATAEQEIVTSPMPVDACRAWNEVSVDVDDLDTDETEDDVTTLDRPPPTGQGPIGLAPGDVLDDDAQEALFEEWQQKVEFYGFVLQENQGTVALVRQTLGSSGVIALKDADPFTPGLNVIPVGTQPVGIATDPTGCHVMTANAGSCDLSRIEVDSVLSGDSGPVVRRLPVQNAAGEILSAEPRALVGQAGNPPLGFECTESPDSLLYIAYPDCNAVAVVHAATGEIRASIVFAEDGSAVLGDGNLTCAAATCGGATTPPVVETPDAGAPDASAPDAGAPDAGAPDAGVVTAAVDVAAVGGRPRPSSLYMAADGGRLYVGADNSPQITVVELDASALPTAAWSVPLEGEVGVTALAATELVAMGGEIGRADEGPFGEFRFVYAAATDGTVRVVEVHNERRECDTQIDPRFLHDERNGQLLACLPLDPARRRVDTRSRDARSPSGSRARSPGIHMPGDARPLAIAFARAPGVETYEDAERPNISPGTVIGTFAFISLSNGTVVVANVDDDNYGDVESTAAPTEVDLALALPHQLRDTGTSRRTSRYCEEADADGDGTADADEDGKPGYDPLVCDFTVASSCAYPAGAVTGPPTITTPPEITMETGYVADRFLDRLPGLRDVACEAEDANGALFSAAVPELSIMAPDPLRELVYPDLEGLGITETWNIVWEGALSSQDVAGLDTTVRVGYLDFEGGVVLRDGASPYCEMGAQPGDVVALVGCDPAFGDGNCRTGETCAVNPDVPLDGQRGICVPEAREREFLDVCSSFLSSRRRYTVAETYADRLVLAERKRTLRTTPTDGCTSAAQCAGLYEIEAQLANTDENAPALGATSPASTDRWACEPDPVRAPDRNVCLMTCASESDCEGGAGWRCSDEGYCVEATLPPAECVASLQRYEVRAGDVFTVTGSVRGHLHDRIADLMTGECVADPTASPLVVGRLPVTAPPCPGDGAELDFTTLTPNPCATTVTQVEIQKVQMGDEEELVKVERQAAAIRIRNPAFSIHVVDPVLDPANQGIECTLDGATCPPMRFVPPSYAITFTIASGFFPYTVVTDQRYPVGMTLDPLGSIWVLDQGDLSSNVRGEVVKLFPLTLELITRLQ